jgi:CelD/BcsL family acetyltransferase involved in cellulose biosynthesis
LTQAPLGVLEALWARATRRGGFDLVRLKHVQSHAAIRPLLSLLGMVEERVEVCLQIAGNWPDGEAWFRNLNKKTRNNHTRTRRILGECGQIVIRQLEHSEPREPVIRRLLELKRLWPNNRGSPLVRNDTTLLALTKALDKLGNLCIFVMECDGVIIAGSVNAVHDDRMLALFATYDPQYDRAGPGIILMTEYTKWAFDEGLTEIDYLLGAEPYKFKFANQRSDLYIYVRGYTTLGRFALSSYRWLQRRRPPETAVSIGSAYMTDKGNPRVVAKQPDKGKVVKLHLTN